MQTASGPSPLLSLLLQSRCSGRVPCATHRDTVGLKTPLKSVLCCGAHPCEGIPPWGSRDYLRLVYAVLAHRRSWRSSANAYPQPPPGHQLCPCPTAPFLPAQETCSRDWTRIWLGGGWQDQAFTASGWHHRAVEPQVLLLPRREAGLGSAVLPALTPAAFSPRDPPLGAASAAFGRSSVPSSSPEHGGCHQPRTQQRSQSPNSVTTQT